MPQFWSLLGTHEMSRWSSLHHVVLFQRAGSKNITYNLNFGQHVKHVYDTYVCKYSKPKQYVSGIVVSSSFLEEDKQPAELI